MSHPVYKQKLFFVGSLSVSGTIFGVLGSLSLSLYSIFTKRVFPKINHDVWLLSYYNNVYAAIMLLPLMLLNNEFQELKSYPQIGDVKFWGIMTVGGVFGFMIGFLTSLQIKVSFLKIFKSMSLLVST